MSQGTSRFGTSGSRFGEDPSEGLFRGGEVKGESKGYFQATKIRQAGEPWVAGPDWSWSVVGDKQQEARGRLAAVEGQRRGKAEPEEAHQVDGRARAMGAAVQIAQAVKALDGGQLATVN